jgi:hypothetical protein
MSYQPAVSGTVVEIDANTTAILRPHARVRDLPIGRLVMLLIETIASEDLIDAVLDDGAQAGAPARKVGRPAAKIAP